MRKQQGTNHCVRHPRPRGHLSFPATLSEKTCCRRLPGRTAPPPATPTPKTSVLQAETLLRGPCSEAQPPRTPRQGAVSMLCPGRVRTERGEEDLLAHGSWGPRREQGQSRQGCPPEVPGTGSARTGRWWQVHSGSDMLSAGVRLPTADSLPGELQSQAKSLNPARPRQTHWAAGNGGLCR